MTSKPHPVAKKKRLKKEKTKWMGKSRKMTERESITKTNIKTTRDIKTKIDPGRTETGTGETETSTEKTERGTETGTAGRGMRAKRGNTRRDDTDQRDRTISCHRTQARKREALVLPAAHQILTHFMTHQP